MKKNSTLEQQTANIITAFKNAKVPLKLYKRNPVPGTNFIVNSPRHRKEIYLYFNDSIKIKTAICKKNRQVLLSILEPKRKLSRDVTIFDHEVNYKPQTIWNRYLGIDLPLETVYSIDLTTPGKPGSNQVNLVLTATVPTSTMYFLVGFDEDHCFISRLPKKVNTVKQAHEILIPEEIKNRHFIRQGEFFFVPQHSICKEVKALDGTTDTPIGVYDNFKELDNSTPHYADLLITVEYVDGGVDELVMGKIETKRHKTIYLPCLHKVYRNTEILNNNSTYID